MTERPELDEVVLGDSPEAWRSLGFAVDRDVAVVGGVRIRLGAGGSGMVGWSLRNLPAGVSAAGTAGAGGGGAGGREGGTDARAGGAAGRGGGPSGGADATSLGALVPSVSHTPPPDPVEHPVGTVAVDHVVALTPDFDGTLRALQAAGLDYRRTRDAGGGFRQAFFVIGPCLLELGGPAPGEEGPRLWGLTLVVADIDAAAARLGDRLGRVKDAVQPGRRIAMVRRAPGLEVPLALITPRSEEPKRS